MFTVTVRAGVVARLLLGNGAHFFSAGIFFSVVKRAKTGFINERLAPAHYERGVSHGAVDTQHYKLQPSIVVEPALAMSGPRWPMSHKYSKPPGRWQREMALGRGTFTDL